MKKYTIAIKGFLKFKTITALYPQKTVIVKKDHLDRGWWFCHYKTDDLILVEWDYIDQVCEWLNINPRFGESTSVVYCPWSSVELYPNNN